MEQTRGLELPGPGRLEAFSDGVLAIAITLLVLEIKVPHLEASQDVRATLLALLALTPKFISYLLSFVFIAVFWVNHHQFFRLVRRVDAGLLWRNILLLLALSFIPFPTAMIGEYPRNPVALAFFAVVLMAAGIAFNLMWRHGQARSLFDAGVSSALVERAKTRGLVGPALYALAAVAAFVLPAAAWVLFIIIPLLYVSLRTNSAVKQ